jgi:hypothetical protein
MTVTQCLAQRSHVHSQVDVFHNTVRPHLGDQLLLAHHIAGMGQQDQQNVHGAATQAQRLVAFEHQTLAGVNPIGAETDGLIRGKTQPLTPWIFFMILTRRGEESVTGRAVNDLRVTQPV